MQKKINYFFDKILLGKIRIKKVYFIEFIYVYSKKNIKFATKFVSLQIGNG
jgi:hypothetical protein